VNRRLAVKAAAFTLCALFFLPLVSCGSLTGFDDGFNGIEIAMGRYGRPNPFIFVLLLIPLDIFILSFLRVGFRLLRNVSTLGFLAVVFFVVFVEMRYDGALRVTVFTWISMAIYVGLAVYCHVCARDKPT
jgi:hypothetical protein